MPPVAESIQDVRDRIEDARSRGSIGLVPTMGALHAGHGSLMAAARRDCRFVVATIFVNPLQFDRPDDLARYPRTLDRDLDFCDRSGVDLVFAPSVQEMYPTPPALSVDVGRLGDNLCGRYRPGHFRGVATVVLKLLQIAQPDLAYFGEKDAQQLAIIRRLVSDFNVPVTIVGVPTVREPDGLAMSSRNARLSKNERSLAVGLYHALQDACAQISAGARDSEAVKKAAVRKIPDAPEVKLEYLEIVDPVEMQPVGRIDGSVRVAGAVWIGSTRLIDNLLCTL